MRITIVIKLFGTICTYLQTCVWTKVIIIGWDKYYIWCSLPELPNSKFFEGTI